MASSPSNANHPRIPGRCDICEQKDGKRNMNFVQCVKCKVCVHRECYMVFPVDGVDDFVCFACAAVGQTFQAVESHLSNDIFEIEQKERPVKCALCSVSSGIHAMYPLFDYHGPGGRQICVTAKSSNKNGKGKERVLVWAHALCALYLASVGFMYACFKDGDYIGMDEDDDRTDSRPPNPELTITKKFQRMYGDAMPHFRYYMKPLSGKLDVWTKAIHENKRELKCIECGLLDDGKSMRIPLQCVANDPNEFSLFRKKHGERNNDVAPCTQALHVGCARWGDPASSVRKVYYFPGTTNPDGSVDYVDTVHCLYCKTHAENVDENYQKLIRQNNALSQKRKQAEKYHSDHKQQHRIRTMKLAPKITSTTCRPVPTKKGMNSASKGTDNSDLVANLKGTKARGRNKNKEQNRYKDLPSSLPGSNVNQQTTSSKKRREISSDTSIATTDDINQIFNDLVSHRDEIAQNLTSSFNGRKKRWKNKLLGLSTTDFDNVWSKARKRFNEYQNRKASHGDNKSGAPTVVVPEPCLDLNELPSPSFDTEDGSVDRREQTRVEGKKRKYINSSGDHSADEIDFNGSKNRELESRKGNDVDQRSCKQPKMTGERSPDRWSKLFIGEPYEMGHEFTFDDFEQNTQSEKT